MSHSGLVKYCVEIIWHMQLEVLGYRNWLCLILIFMKLHYDGFYFCDASLVFIVSSIEIMNCMVVILLMDCTLKILKYHKRHASI